MLKRMVLIAAVFAVVATVTLVSVAPVAAEGTQPKAWGTTEGCAPWNQTCQGFGVSCQRLTGKTLPAQTVVGCTMGASCTMSGCAR